MTGLLLTGDSPADRDARFARALSARPAVFPCARNALWQRRVQARVSALARLDRFCRRPGALEDLVDKKQAGEQSAEMNRRVQVVDQLRADVRLDHDQLDRREGV